MQVSQQLYHVGLHVTMGMTRTEVEQQVKQVVMATLEEELDTLDRSSAYGSPLHMSQLHDFSCSTLSRPSILVQFDF